MHYFSVSVVVLCVFCPHTGRKCDINIYACDGIHFNSLTHVYSHSTAGLCRKPPWPTTQRTRSTPPMTCPSGSPCSLRRPAALLAEPSGWDLKWVVSAVALPSSLLVKSSCLIFSLYPDRGNDENLSRPFLYDCMSPTERLFQNGTWWHL